MTSGISYHVNPDTGRAGICRATEKRGCQFGVDTPHFETKDEARAHIEKIAQKEYSKFAIHSSKQLNETTYEPTKYKPQIKYPVAIVTNNKLNISSAHRGTPAEIEYNYGGDSIAITVPKNSSQLVKLLHDSAANEITRMNNYRKAVEEDNKIRPALASLHVTYNVANLNDIDSYGDSYNEATKREQVDGLVQTGLVDEDKKDAAYSVLSQAADAYDGGARESRGTYLEDRNISITKALRKAKLLNL